MCGYVYFMLRTRRDGGHLTIRRCEIFNTRGRHEKFVSDLAGKFKLKRRFGKASHRWKNVNSAGKTWDGTV